MSKRISRTLRGAVGVSAAALVGGGLAAVGATPAMAATTLDVCASSCTYSTIQDAVNNASAGDTIEVAAGTYNESVDVNKGVTIIGAGTDDSSGTVIQGNSTLDFTGMPANNSATVKDLRVQLEGGNASGITATHNLTVDNVVFDYNGVLNYHLLASHLFGAPHTNSEPGGGGGASSADVTNLTVKNSTFIGGNTGGWNSMVHLGGGTGSVEHVHITDVTLDLEDKAAGIALAGVTGDDIVVSGVTATHTNTDPNQPHGATAVYIAAKDHDNLHVSVSDSDFTDFRNGVHIVPALQNTTTNGIGPEYELSGITTTGGIGVHVQSPSGASSTDLATVRGMTITGSDLSHGRRGLFLDGHDTMEVSGLTVSDSHFDDNNWGGFSSNLVGDDALTNVTVQNSTFNDNAFKGIYLQGISDAVFKNVTVDGSGNAADGTKSWPGAGIDLSLKHGDYKNIKFQDVTITNSGGMNGGYGLGVRPHSDGTVDGVTVTGGSITGSPTGVFLEADPGGFQGTPVISGVDLSGNTDVAIDTTTGGFSVDANDNYWGSANPDFSTLVTGQGTVDHSTWKPTPGPQPEPGGDGSLGSLFGSLGSLGSS